MSFSFADRLVTQRIRLHERTVNIETETESLAVKQQLIEKLKERLESAQVQLAKVESMRESLEKMDAATEAAYQEAKKKDEEARAVLASDYQTQIDEVNGQLQEMGQREAKANRLNTTYKQQIEIYSEKSTSGEAKFDDYMQQREDKVAEVKAKQLRDAAKIPEFQEQLEKEKETLTTARAEHTEVKTKVDVYLQRFADVQKQLEASKATYETAKGEKERLLRTVRALESDKAMVIKRAELSRAERDKQLAKVKKMEEQLDGLKTQTERLDKMCATFEGKEPDTKPATEKAHTEQNTNDATGEETQPQAAE